MEIVVLDGYTENPGDLSWDAVKSFGTLTVYDRTPADDAIICKRIGNADIVITNKTPISAYVIASCPSIKFISVLATGYNVVDTHAAAKAGIPVSNIPTYGTMAVGQFAIAMLLEICHHIGAHNDAVHQGRWGTNPDWCFWDSPLIELAQKTLQLETPSEVPNVTNTIIGSVSKLCEYAKDVCTTLGYDVTILTDRLTCEAREAGRFLGSIALAHANTSEHLAFLAGGETVVHLMGKGLGGRNQEIALAAASQIEGIQNVAVFSFGSDGTDGPTDAAGGYVDGKTSRLVDIDAALQASDSYHALQKSGGLLVTGPTGTNVNDLAVVLIN